MPMIISCAATMYARNLDMLMRFAALACSDQLSPRFKQTDAVSLVARGSDALVEKRRADKVLIARMLDMDEPFLTEKVCTARAPKKVLTTAPDLFCIFYPYRRYVMLRPPVCMCYDQTARSADSVAGCVKWIWSSCMQIARCRQKIVVPACTA